MKLKRDHFKGGETNVSDNENSSLSYTFGTAGGLLLSPKQIDVRKQQRPDDRHWQQV